MKLFGIELFGKKKKLQTNVKELQRQLAKRSEGESNFANELWERQLKYEGEYQEGLLDAFELFQRHCGRRITGSLEELKSMKPYYLDLTKHPKVRGEEEEE